MDEINTFNEEEISEETFNETSEASIEEQIENDPLFKTISKFFPSSEELKDMAVKVLQSDNMDESVDEFFNKFESKIEEEAKEEEIETYAEQENGLEKKAYFNFIHRYLSKIPVYGNYWIRVEALKRFLKDKKASYISRALVLCLLIYSTNPFSLTANIISLGVTAISDVVFYFILKMILKLSKEEGILDKYIEEVKAEYSNKKPTQTFPIGGGTPQGGSGTPQGGSGTSQGGGGTPQGGGGTPQGGSGTSQGGGGTPQGGSGTSQGGSGNASST